MCWHLDTPFKKVGDDVYYSSHTTVFSRKDQCNSQCIECSTPYLPPSTRSHEQPYTSTAEPLAQPTPDSTATRVTVSVCQRDQSARSPLVTELNANKSGRGFMLHRHRRTHLTLICVVGLVVRTGLIIIYTLNDYNYAFVVVVFLSRVIGALLLTTF